MNKTDQGDKSRLDGLLEKAQKRWFVRAALVIAGWVASLILVRAVTDLPTPILLLMAFAITVPVLALAIWPDQITRLAKRSWQAWAVIFPAAGTVALLFMINTMIDIQNTVSEEARRREQERLDLKNFRIAIVFDSWIGFGPFYVAQEKGYFGDLEISLRRTHGSGEKRRLMYERQIEAFAETIDMLEFSAQAAAVAPGIVVFALDRSVGGDALIVSEKIANVEDLIGKTVALEHGSPGHFILAATLQDAGHSLDKVFIRMIGVQEARHAFIRGDIDAAVSWSPHLADMLRYRTGSRILLSSGDMDGAQSIVDVLVVRRDVLITYPEMVKQVVIGWCTALEFLKTYPDEGKVIMARALQLSRKVLEEQMAGVQFLGFPDNASYFGDGGSESEIYKNIIEVRKVWQAAGFSQDTIDVSRRFSNKIVRALTSEEAVRPSLR